MKNKLKFKNIIKDIKCFFRHPELNFDRSFAGGYRQQINWLLSAFVLIFVLLLVVYYFVFPVEGSFADRVYILLFQLICPGSSEYMPAIFAVIVDVVGLIIFSGMLIAVVSNMLERRVEAYQNGETVYKLSHHIVIIGYNDSVPSLVKTLRTQSNGAYDEDTFILILSVMETNEVRNHIHMCVNGRLEKNTIVVHGQSNSKEAIERLCVDTCQKVYVIGDKNMEAHDSSNMETVRIISSIWRSHQADKDSTVLKHRLHCHVLFEYQTMYSIFQFSQLQPQLEGAIYFHPFNLYENWAKKVVVEGKAWAYNADAKIDYLPLEGKAGLQKDSSKHVHLIIIGMSRMGTSLAVEAAQIAHYPNFREHDHATRTHITFIDANAEEEMDTFKSRYPNVFDMMRWRYADSRTCKELYSLYAADWVNPMEEEDSDYHHLGVNFTDIQWEFVNGRVESTEVRNYLNKAVADESAITTIAVCLPGTQNATRAALYLPDKVLKKAQQVLVYQVVNDAIIRNVNNPDDTCTKFDNVLPFGNYNDSYSNEKIGEYEGKWINAYYAGEYGSPADKQAWSRKDIHWMQQKWDNCTVSEKWSSIHSANMIHTKLRSIGCTMCSDITTIRNAVNTHMDTLVYTEHNRWVTEQLLAGFRPYNKEEWENYMRVPTGERGAHNKNKYSKAHANICSNSTLKEAEPDSHGKDKQVTMALLEIIALKQNSL